MEAERSMSHQANILMTDDNEANLDALELILRTPCYNLVRASSGEDALRCLMIQEFALILMDVRLPGMDGFECAKLIRANRRYNDTPIIFLTGVATDLEFIFKGYGAGGVDYVIKPFEPAVIKAKVAVFVELFNSRRLLRYQIEELKTLSARLRQEIEDKTHLLEDMTSNARPQLEKAHVVGLDQPLH